MAQFIDQAVSSVLSRNRLKLSHPGASQLSNLYASPQDCTSSLAETIQSYNRLRIPANNLNLATQTNFTISTSSIITSLWLEVSIVLGAGCKLPHDGWLFDAIDNIQFTFSNSALNNIIMMGQCFRDYMLLSCKNRTDREQLLKLAGTSALAAATARACVPLGHILANASFQSGQWGIDASVLNGPIQVQIVWKPGYKFVVKNNAGFTVPTAWASCEITGMTTDLADSAFAVRSAMAVNSSLIYTLPGHYYSSVTYTLPAVATGVEQVVNLQSAPAGMLQCILLSIRPNGAVADGAGPPATSSDWTGIAAGTALIHGESVRLSSLSLQYGGMNLVACTSHEEILSMNMSAFDGDDLTYDIRACTNAGDADIGQQVNHAKIICIPFGYDMRKIFSYRHSESLSSYSGASLQLRFTSADGFVSLNASPYLDTADTRALQAVQYEVIVTYIVDALVEVSGGTVDLVV